MIKFEGKTVFIILSLITVINLVAATVYAFISPRLYGMDVALSVLHGAFALYTGDLAIKEYQTIQDNEKEWKEFEKWINEET